jgi:four helix bundle protein
VEKLSNKEFGKVLEKRTLLFSVSILKMCALLPYKQEVKVVIHQLSKSATSVGANYREANVARSSADFYNKLKICQSEMNETIYWLEIIGEMNWLSEKESIEKLKTEANELLAIFTSTILNLKTKKHS